MITKEQLERYCVSGKEAERRPGLARPFTIGENSYATDGRILVRVPEVAGVAAPEREIGVERVLQETPETDEEWIDIPALPALPALPAVGNCLECEGEGQVVWTYRDKTVFMECHSQKLDCPICDGSGNGKEKPVAFEVSGMLLDARRLATIADLPGVQIQLRRDYGPVRFRFDGGGVGLLMMMRKMD